MVTVPCRKVTVAERYQPFELKEVAVTGREKIRIALDGMGGDFAPREVVRGAVRAAREGGVEILLVGPEDRLQAELTLCNTEGLPIQLHHTDQFIVDGESPAAGLRAKPRASVALCAQLASKGHADGAVSMGHTGACMITAHWAFGPLPGIHRPVAGAILSPLAPHTLVFDLGANADCKPEQFLQFAAVGVGYARCLLGLNEPTVGLLSNGTEPGKGIPQTRAAYELLEKSPFNFVGYVEGWDLVRGRVNVALCDGFVGNILIKYTEGLGAAMAQWLTQRLADQLPPSEIEDLAETVRGMMEIEERIGGGPLLGIDGVMVVGHGRSRAGAVARAVDLARQVVEGHLVEVLRDELARVADTISYKAN